MSLIVNQMPTVPEDDSEKTRVIRRSPKVDQQEPARSDAEIPAAPTEESEMTRLIGPPRRARVIAPETIEEKTSGLGDPVIGWLVIVSGPGRGNSKQLGYGQNSIGRDREERVCLNFGDDGVSRQKHCFVIYDPRERRYTLRPGDGTTLTYLNGKLISQPRPLKAGDKIEVGRTTLQFVPFCGPDFEWQDQPQSDAEKSA